MTSERRVDPFLGTPVHVVTTRQDRPNLPSDECPFCVVALCEPRVDIDAWIVSPVGGAQRFDDDTDDVN